MSKYIKLSIDELRDLINLLNSYRYLLCKYFKKDDNPLLDCYFNYLVYLDCKYSKK